eukprot:s1_g1636.t1
MAHSSTERSRGRPRSEKSDDLRRAILDAAVDLFGARGFDGVSLGQIASEVGADVALTRYYFGSKHEVWIAAITHLTEQIEAEADRTVDPEQTSQTDQLKAAIQDFIAVSARWPQLSRIIVFDGDKEDERGKYIAQHVVQPFYKRMSKLIRGAKKEGTIPNVTERTLFFMITHGGSFPMAQIALYLLGLLSCVAHLERAVAEDTIDIVLVGDTGFNSAGARVTPEGGYKQGQLVRIDDALSGIVHELNADIVLANLETAVTARNDIRGVSKRFTFRTHPSAVEAFVDAGINAFSLANNHALDYRQRGAGETLINLERMRPRGLLAYPGLGQTRDDAAAPHSFSLAGTRVAVSSIGIGGWGLPTKAPNAGMLTYPADFEPVSQTLRSADADVRILAVHYGREFQPATSEATRARFRSAIAPEGLTIIAGHHKHIATGIEMVQTPTGSTGLIFYGLGNFLHLGMQNMGRHDMCHDFGLLARIRLIRADDGTVSLHSVRVVPLTDMHRATKPLAPEPSAVRVAVLNHLSAQLDAPEDGVLGLRFNLLDDGSGLWCHPAAAVDGYCSSTKPPAVPQNTATQIARACRRVLTR